MLCLQNGKFDATDRMFYSISDNWFSCLNNPTDLKELIPEFFCGNGEFLLNNDDLNLGHRHTGERLGDVGT
jgi:factor associated with neutral sphingomyelinase activation